MHPAHGPEDGIPVTNTWLASMYPGYTLSITDSVASSEISRFEIDYAQQLAFLPGVLSGIGVFANYTRFHFDTWDNYLNSAKDTWNAGLSFKTGGILRPVSRQLHRQAPDQHVGRRPTQRRRRAPHV